MLVYISDLISGKYYEEENRGKTLGNPFHAQNKNRLKSKNLLFKHHTSSTSSPLSKVSSYPPPLIHQPVKDRF